MGPSGAKGGEKKPVPSPEKLPASAGGVITDDSGKVVIRSFRLVFDRGYRRLFKIDRYRLPFAYGWPLVVAPLPRFVNGEKPARKALKAGEHLFAQTMQSFTYLKERRARGEIVLPEGSAPLSSFGQEALLKY